MPEVNKDLLSDISGLYAYITIKILFYKNKLLSLHYHWSAFMRLKGNTSANLGQSGCCKLYFRSERKPLTYNVGKGSETCNKVRRPAFT